MVGPANSWQTGLQVGGGWTMKAIQGPIAYTITDGKRDRTDTSTGSVNRFYQFPHSVSHQITSHEN